MFTLAFGIDVEQGINVGTGKFGKKINIGAQIHTKSIHITEIRSLQILLGINRGK